MKVLNKILNGQTRSVELQISIVAYKPCQRGEVCGEKKIKKKFSPGGDQSCIAKVLKFLL